jgi:exodeoxyribonuclease VII large subunit
VVVLIRGGGSLEDLIAFSTEPVARAVAASRTPIIVGVGHEIDVSLADYAADMRAATPTDAARLVVPDRAEILARIGHLGARQDAALSRVAHDYRRRTDQSLSRLEAALRHPRERVQALTARLTRGLDRLAADIRAHQQYSRTLSERLTERTGNLLIERRGRVVGLERVLRGFDPSAVLSRGYSIVRSEGKVLRRANDTAPGNAVMIQLAEGNIAAEVHEVHDS